MSMCRDLGRSTWVSFAEYFLFYRALFQKRPVILSILLTRVSCEHVQRFGEINVAEMVVASKTLDIDDMVKSVCDVSSRVCTLGTGMTHVCWWVGGWVGE